MQVVIDTNIIISAFLSGYGKCRVFMDKVFAGEYDVIVSESVFEEYKRKLYHPKFAFADETINFVLNWFRVNALWIEVNEEQAVPEMDTKDVSDKPFYLLARSTHSLLVTGNIKDYPVEEWRTMIWELI